MSGRVRWVALGVLLISGVLLSVAFYVTEARPEQIGQRTLFSGHGSGTQGFEPRPE